MQNGYALPVTMAMQELGTRLANEEGLAEKRSCTAGWRALGHGGLTATHTPCVSGLCVRGSGRIHSVDQLGPFALFVLRAAYDATLLVGRLKAARAGKRVRVYLTMLGGGAFGNRDVWVRCDRGRTRAAQAPIDVVHYGTFRHLRGYTLHAARRHRDAQCVGVPPGYVDE